jgi:hypothetical protein
MMILWIQTTMVGQKVSPCSLHSSEITLMEGYKEDQWSLKYMVLYRVFSKFIGQTRGSY